MNNLSFYAPFLLIPFAVQLVILSATAKRFRPLRFAVPILIGAVCIIAILLCCIDILDSFDVPFLENIGVLLGPLFILIAVILCLILASLALAGWGLAWLVYYLVYYLVKRTGAHKSQL